MSHEGKIAVVDIETTGFLNQGGLIVEIGIAELDLQNGCIEVVFDSIVREDTFSISHARHPYGWIFQNSDLRFQDVMEAPGLNQIKPVIQDILDQYPVGATAFNKAFDFPFLRSRGFVIRDQACIMQSATPVLNLPSRNGYSNPKWPNVQEAWDHFFGKSSYREAHRAADDAIHEAKILYELIKRNAFKIRKV